MLPLPEKVVACQPVAGDVELPPMGKLWPIRAAVSPPTLFSEKPPPVAYGVPAGQVTFSICVPLKADVAVTTTSFAAEACTPWNPWVPWGP